MVSKNSHSHPSTYTQKKRIHIKWCILVVEVLCNPLYYCKQCFAILDSFQNPQSRVEKETKEKLDDRIVCNVEMIYYSICENIQGKIL